MNDQSCISHLVLPAITSDRIKNLLRIFVDIALTCKSTVLVQARTSHHCKYIAHSLDHPPQSGQPDVLLVDCPLILPMAQGS